MRKIVTGKKLRTHETQRAVRSRSYMAHYVLSNEVRYQMWDFEDDMRELSGNTSEVIRATLKRRKREIT